MVDNPTGGAFNPTDPQVAVPDWLHLAKGITPPKADASLGNLFEGIGKVGTEAIVVADNLTKFSLEDKIHSGIDDIRNKYTEDAKNTLAAIKGQPQGTQVPGSTTSLFAQSIEANLPKDLQNLPKKLDTLDAAKGSGKYSPTFLDMQYDALAKDFRSRYPGYRDFIDQQFEKSTGSNPANATVRSLLSDINSFIAKKDVEKEKVNNLLRDAVGKGMPLMGVYARHTAGVTGDIPAMGELNAYMAPQQEWHVKSLQMAAYKNDLEQQHLFASQILPKRADDIAKGHFKDLTIIDPATIDPNGPGSGKPILLSQFVSEVQAGKRPPPNSQEWELIGNQVTGNIRETEAHIRGEFSQVHPETKRSWMEMGGDKSEPAIKNALAIHNLMDTAIRNKDTGLAAFASRMSEAKDNDALWGLKNLKGGDSVALVQAANKAGGEKLVSIFFSRNIIREENLPQLDKDALTNLSTKLHFNDLRRPGETIYTPTDQLTDAAARGVSKAGLNAVTREAEALVDPKVSDIEKSSIAKGAYGPENKDYIKLFNADKVEAGKFIEGRNTIFNRWSNPAVTKNIWDLSQKTGDKTLWDNYKTRTQDWVGTDLLPHDIAILNAATQSPSQNATITYDNKGIEFTVHTKDKTAYGREIKTAVQHINDYIKNMAAIAKQEGKDPNEYVLDLMQHTRGMLDMEHVKSNNLTTQMIRAAVAAHSPPKEVTPPAEGKPAKPEPVQKSTVPEITPATPPGVNRVEVPVAAPVAAPAVEQPIPPENHPAPQTPAQRYQAIKDRRRQSGMSPAIAREIQPGRIPMQE